MVALWLFFKPNGITECLHTKVEMISRCALGFRNFENYRRQVLAWPIEQDVASY